MSHVLGVGASSAVTPDELAQLVDEVLRQGGVGPTDVTAVGTVDHRVPHVLELCAQRGWELHAFTAEELAAVPVPHPSDRVAQLAGTPSVAEAAARLLAPVLVVGKTSSAHATAALSRTDPA